MGRFTKDNSNLTAPPVLIFVAGSGGLVTSDAANEALKQVMLRQHGLALPERYSATTRSVKVCSTAGSTPKSFGYYSTIVLSKKFPRSCGEQQSRNGDYLDLREKRKRNPRVRDRMSIGLNTQISRKRKCVGLDSLILGILAVSVLFGGGGGGNKIHLYVVTTTN